HNRETGRRDANRTAGSSANAGAGTVVSSGSQLPGRSTGDCGAELNHGRRAECREAEDGRIRRNARKFQRARSRKIWARGPTGRYGATAERIAFRLRIARLACRSGGVEKGSSHGSGKRATTVSAPAANTTFSPQLPAESQSAGRAGS